MNTQALQKDRSIEEIDGYAENAGDLENCCIHHVIEDPDRGGTPGEILDALGIRNDRPPEELRIMNRSEHRKIHHHNAKNSQIVKQQREALNCFKEIARFQLRKIPYDELVNKIWCGGWSYVGDSCWKILFQKEVWKEIGRRWGDKTPTTKKSRESRNQKIFAAIDAGKKYAAVAAEFGLSEAMVKKLARKHKESKSAESEAV